MDRRRNNDGRRQYNIQELRDKHREIMRHVVLGRNNTDTAEMVGCTPQTVSNIRNSPLGQAEAERLHFGRDEVTMDIAKRIESFAPHALTVLEDIITGRMPGVSAALRAKISSGHLARAGYGEIHKVRSLHAHLSLEDIDAIKQDNSIAVTETSYVVQGTTRQAN